MTLFMINHKATIINFFIIVLFISPYIKLFFHIVLKNKCKSKQKL